MTPDTVLVHEVLAAGLKAPSAENKHFVQFRLRDGGFQLLATDPSCALLPHRRWLAAISHGAMAENMVLHAALRGVGLGVTWLPEAGNPELVADFEWLPGASGGPDALANMVYLRHTNRRFFKKTPLPAQTLSRIEAAAASAAGARLVWLSGEDRTLALRAIKVAETERFKRMHLHAELFSAVRFDAGWRATTDEGLPPAALEVEPPMRPVFAALRHWSVMHALTRLGVHHMLGLRSAYLPCAMAPHLGLVVTNASLITAEAPMLAGRAFERAWLCAAAEGAAFQPQAAPVALAMQDAAPGWVCEPVKSRIQQLLAPIAARHNAVPQMFFRLGLARGASAVTGRPAVDGFIA